jgi:hypothetical protein
MSKISTRRKFRRDFRVFRDTEGKECRRPLTAVFLVVQSMAVSGTECERVFCSECHCNCHAPPLHVNTMSKLVFLKPVRPSRVQFDPAEDVCSWLAKGQQGALGTKPKSRDRKKRSQLATNLEFMLRYRCVCVCVCVFIHTHTHSYSGTVVVGTVILHKTS